MIASSDERLNATQLTILRLLHGYFMAKKVQWGIIDQKWMMKKALDWYGYKIPRLAKVA